MNIYILNSRIGYQPENDEIVLNENHFHPCKPFFLENTFKPESVSYIFTKGILEKTRYIRYILKIIDSLLELNGEFKIEFFRISFDSGGGSLRPLNYLMNEISVCYKDRYKVFKKEFKDNIDTIWLRKIQSSLPSDDKITRWSFGIVSDGRKNDRVLNILQQIKEFNIPEYEILICGPSPSEKLPEEVKVLGDSDLYFDTRIPISRKKNRIIDKAKYNNLAIMHDRISFRKDWFTKIMAYGNYFDQICFPILDEDTGSLRVNDWLAAIHDFTHFQDPGSRYLKYSEWDRHIYVDGGFMLVKKHILDKVKLNPCLNWGEMEDVDLSERLYYYGNCVTFYEKAVLLTQTHRIKPFKQPESYLRKLFGPAIRKLLKYLRNNRLERRFKDFLKKEIQ